jgi:serine/threonine protein kinase/Tfp pilus assembly protein PilF
MVGKEISHYRILEELGRGGMGVVYKAQDTRLDRLVALKFLPPELTHDAEAKLRLTREATALSSLQHRNICVIHDIDQSPDGQLFLTMEYLEGNTLRNEIESNPLPVDRVLHIALEVAHGLASAHQRGTVHRDIKPGNIILGKNLTIKILDFGLASLVGRELQLSEPQLAGTIEYMSPEQARGEPVDRRTDIWSLGVVMYEMITGHNPFSRQYQQASLYAITNERHPPVSSLRPEVPSLLERIIDRCLEKSPEARYESAEALIDDLQKVSPAPGETEETAGKSIAVLPFSDISPEKDNAYFTEGLTEEIVVKLSRLRNLKILPLPSVMSYDRNGKSMKQIAADLGVQYLLMGSVRKHGSDLRVATQLVKGDAEAVIWGETQNGAMEKVFDIQEHVANRVVHALKLRLTPGEKRSLKRRATENTEAFQLYLRGRFFWNKRRKESLWTAVRYFEQAIEKDPHYAPAWAGIADSYNMLTEHTASARRELYDKAIVAARKALSYDDRLAEAHASLGILLMLTQWDWSGSEREYKSAIRLNPNYAIGHHWYAEWLAFQGRFREALAEIAEAERLDPLSPSILNDRGMILYYSRDYDGAVEVAHRVLELERDFIIAHRLLSLAYQGKGMFEESLDEHRRWVAAGGGGGDAAIAHAHCLAAAGRREDAEKLLTEPALSSASTGNACRGVALVYAALGNIDQAFLWLEKAAELRAESFCMLKVDPKLDPLRGDARFESLLARTGLK